jgi:type IV pilus assembly protein PilC
VAKFKYTAVDPAGGKVSGTLEAPSAVRARNDLLGREYQMVEVKERKPFTEIEITTKKIKPADLMNFSRQLAAFLRAGIPILDALEALTDDASSKQLKKVLVSVTDALRAGSTFSDAIAAHEEMFPSYYVGILRSAELTGNLDIVMEQLSRYIERDLEATRTLKSALTYPAVIFVMAIGTVAVLVTYVLPRFQDFFKSFKAKLPLPTRMLISFGDFMGKWWWLIFGTIIVVVIASYAYAKTEKGRYRRDKLLLKTPVIGDVVECAAIERFCRILGAMLRAGVSIPEAMTASSDASNNRVYRKALVNARDAMLRGEGLARPLADTGLFPGAAAQMLRVGEDSGTLDLQLETAAGYYESELNYKVKRLTTLFEPLVIVVMGVIVGFVAIALVSAMYGIFNQVKVK